MTSNDVFHSPTRPIMPKPTEFPSPPFRDQRMYPWNWGESAKVQFSPASSCGSPTTPSQYLTPLKSPDSSDSERDNLKRGRPRFATITTLMKDGSKASNAIQCNVCSRVFPREKSLQAHLRTHTGNKLYIVCNNGYKVLFSVPVSRYM